MSHGPTPEGTVSAGRCHRVRMLAAPIYVARTRSSPERSLSIKPQVPLSPSTFSHFDHVGSCGTLLHRGSAGSQAWGSAPEGSRWIPSRPFTYVPHAWCLLFGEDALTKRAFRRLSEEGRGDANVS